VVLVTAIGAKQPQGDTKRDGRFPPIADVGQVRTCRPALRSKVHLLRQLQSVVNFDSEIPDGAVQFRMAEQELAGS